MDRYDFAVEVTCRLALGHTVVTDHPAWHAPRVVSPPARCSCSPGSAHWESQPLRGGDLAGRTAGASTVCAVQATWWPAASMLLRA